jgi:hypothetical protein
LFKEAQMYEKESLISWIKRKGIADFTDQERFRRWLQRKGIADFADGLRNRWFHGLREISQMA